MISHIFPKSCLAERHQLDQDEENNRHHHFSHKLLAEEYNLIEQEAYDVLEKSIRAYVNGTEPPDAFNLGVFADVRIALPLANSVVHLSDGRGDEEKYFVAPRSIAKRGKGFIVYAAGVDNRPVFERYMAEKLNNSVFAFDCTNQKNPAWTTFEFYPWCIGESKDFSGNQYARNSADKSFKFKPLTVIKKELNHPHVDMLKMDIEGCEWDILQKDIVEGHDHDLPSQLLFELHTEGANRRYVPPNIVAGKQRQQVVKLLFDLYQRNYRIVHFEGNIGDRRCMEFAFLRVRSVTTEEAWHKINTVIPFPPPKSAAEAFNNKRYLRS